MATIDDQQIERMLEDIASIKTVVNRNRPILNQILLPGHFRFFSLIAGVSIVGFALAFFFLIGRYGSYAEIPIDIKSALHALIVLDWLFLAFLKWSRWGKGLLRIDRRFTLWRALEELFSFRIVHVYLPLTGVMVLLCVFLAHQNAYYIIPTISIFCGLMYNFIGVITELRQWLLPGYWFLLTGSLFFIGPISAPLAIAISLGGGNLIFAAIANREI